MGTVLVFQPQPRVGTREYVLLKRQQLQEAWDRQINSGFVPSEAAAEAVAVAMERADRLLSATDIQWEPFTGNTAS